MTSLFFLAIPQSDTAIDDLRPPNVLGCCRVTRCVANPKRQGSDPFVRPLCDRLRLQPAAWPFPLPPIMRRYLQLRIPHIDALILVHIHHEYFAHRIQAPQEGRLFSMIPIGTYPCELHTQVTLVADH